MTRRLIALAVQRWDRWIWLVYALPYLITSALAPYRPLEKTLLLLAFAVFLALYVAGQLVRGPRILWVIVGLDILAVATSAHNPAATCFFIYAAASIAHGFTTRTALKVLMVQVLLGGVAGVMLDGQWWFYMASMLIAGVIGVVTIQDEATKAGNAKLRMAHEEVERLAKLAERERIARDMHDVLGHTLSVIVLKSELAQKLFARDSARAAQEIADVERIARKGLAEVREAITGYRSTGLNAEIEHVRDTLHAAGIVATVDASPVALAPAQETALSLALREAATNVIRHASASSCHIRFYAQDASVLMEVTDDGRGGDAPFGHGLTGMRERIQQLGGVLRRETAGGTRLLIELPRRASSSAADVAAVTA